MTFAIIVASLLLASGASARKFTIQNNCAYTIWPAIYTDPNGGGAIPDHATGWEAAPGSTEEIEMPDNWKSGRIWGRRDCDFSKDGAVACATGSCNGGLECAKTAGTGVPPVTVAEWTLGDGNGPDNYDVSLVDGFNIPMSVTPTAGCPVADCPAELNANCPAELQLQGPGGIAGCKSACMANLDGNPQDSPNCCSGSHNVPETCPPTGVKYYDYFKSPCKNSYAYAYDESSKTALWTCDAAKKADYAVVFCPGGGGAAAPAPAGSAPPPAGSAPPPAASAPPPAGSPPPPAGTAPATTAPPPPPPPPARRVRRVSRLDTGKY